MYYFSSTYSVDYFSLDTFDDFERKRLARYLDNLTLNPPEHPFELHKSSNDSQEIISFDRKSPHFIDKNQALLKRGNEETLFDLEQLEQHHFFNPKKLVKISTYADSVQWYTIPTLVKARYNGAKTIHQPYAILMRFRSRVHFGQFGTVKEHDIPFEKKKSTVLWRGGPSGNGFKNANISYIVKASREDLLKLWCQNDKVQDDIDVGLVEKWEYKSFEKYIKPRMEIKDMLKYKYLLSIEGNDVATNLKWAMASQSLVIMPHPRVESWFCETLLKPYVHYVPVKDDFSDLLEIKKWCDKNSKKCKQIIQNANKYVQAFMNEERERMMAIYVLETYMQKVEIVIK
ncbi:hypothetical protein EBU71_20915 [bacterium]|nr:hypothetical protein [Candidatus Elulimicrobium humile]